MRLRNRVGAIATSDYLNSPFWRFPANGPIVGAAIPYPLPRIFRAALQFVTETKSFVGEGRNLPRSQHSHVGGDDTPP